MGRGISQQTDEIINKAFEILQEQNPMTLRQLFYQLVSSRILQNRQKEYQKLSRIMTYARDRDRVPCEWMVDRNRPTYSTEGWKDLDGYMKTIATGYRRDYWQDQPYHVEVWTEKDAIYGSFQPVTDEYGITVRVHRGFMSTTRAYEIGNTFDGSDKPICVLFLGDHDPSGRCIEEDADRRVEERTGREFDRERVAIHFEDIGKFNLPPLRINTRDTRARGFRRQHGEDCVELDTLPANELRDRLEEKIREFLDLEAWDRAIRVEKAEMDSFKLIASRMLHDQKGGSSWKSWTKR